MTPVEKFSTTTSAVAISSRTIPNPCADFRSRATLRLLRLVQRNGAPCMRSGCTGGYWRKSSPRPGASILITSAPMSASIIVASGPAMKCVKSTTLIPSKAFGASAERGVCAGNSLSRLFNILHPSVCSLGLPGSHDLRRLPWRSAISLPGRLTNIRLRQEDGTPRAQSAGPLAREDPICLSKLPAALLLVCTCCEWRARPREQPPVRTDRHRSAFPSSSV